MGTTSRTALSIGITVPVIKKRNGIEHRVYENDRETIRILKCIMTIRSIPNHKTYSHLIATQDVVIELCAE